jgi:hypothetical protein
VLFLDTFQRAATCRSPELQLAISSDTVVGIAQSILDSGSQT